MSKPTEHTIGLGFVTTAVLQRKKRLKTVSPFGAGSGPTPPVDSPLKVFNGTEWVSTGVSVVAPS